MNIKPFQSMKNGGPDELDFSVHSRFLCVLKWLKYISFFSHFIKQNTRTTLYEKVNRGGSKAESPTFN